MGGRREKLGIKQTIQLSWMDKTLQLVLAGLSAKEIRSELDGFLSTQLQRGGEGERGKKTYVMGISILAAWFSPESELIGFRDDALRLARQLPKEKWLPLHWAVLSASYPFWFQVGRRVGRLFNLQDQITQKQIFSRLVEQYGDRETVARNARYAVRSFVAWGALVDSTINGCYELASPLPVGDHRLVSLLFESVLLAMEDGKAPFGLLVNEPAFFPFRFPQVNGELIAQASERIEVLHIGLDDEYLQLKIG